MDLSKLTDQAKKLIDDRGGMDALKEDAMELKDIATGEGSLTDKAKAAVDAVKDPGAGRAPRSDRAALRRRAGGPARRCAAPRRGGRRGGGSPAGGRGSVVVPVGVGEPVAALVLAAAAEREDAAERRGRGSRTLPPHPGRHAHHARRPRGRARRPRSRR